VGADIHFREQRACHFDAGVWANSWHRGAFLLAGFTSGTAPSRVPKSVSPKVIHVKSVRSGLLLGRSLGP
jgi:hypothetical protein